MDMLWCIDSRAVFASSILMSYGGIHCRVVEIISYCLGGFENPERAELFVDIEKASDFAVKQVILW